MNRPTLFEYMRQRAARARAIRRLWRVRTIARRRGDLVAVIVLNQRMHQADR